MIQPPSLAHSAAVIEGNALAEQGLDAFTRFRNEVAAWWHDPESLITGLQSLPAWVGVLALGILLLFFGRRLYWLLLGAVGFVLGFFLFSQLPLTGAWWPWIAGLIGGVLGAVMARFVQGVLLVVVGGILGALAGLMAATLLHWQSTAITVLVVVAGAVLGAILLRTLFAVTLIVVSALVGANLVVQSLAAAFFSWDASSPFGFLARLGEPGPTRWIAVAVLFVIGAGAQMRGRETSDDEPRRSKRRRRSLEKEVRHLRREKRDRD